MKTLLLCATILAFMTSSSAQTDSTKADSTGADSTDSPNGIHIGRGTMSIKAGLSFEIKSPSITLGYGSSNFQSKTVDLPVQATREIEFAMGNFREQHLRSTKKIARADFDRLFVQLYATDYGATKDTSLIQLKGWRFGLHIVGGYSYLRESGEASLSLLHTGGPLWSFNTFTNESKGNTAAWDADQSRKFSDLARSHFGSHTGFIIRYDFTTAISIDGSFERTMMFNDYSFFGWVGSVLLEGIAQGLLTGNVIHSIEIKSPVSAPVTNVILRTALSFGIYELRRSHQHFPFGGNSPIVMDAARLSISFAF